MYTESEVNVMNITKAEYEKAILNYMNTLDLTREEAEQLWADDNSDEMTPEQAELEKKFKESGMGRHVGETIKERKKREFIRKVDEEKGSLISEFNKVLEALSADDIVIKTETEISFTYNDNKYTLKLTKHRPPKK